MSRICSNPDCQRETYLPADLCPYCHAPVREKAAEVKPPPAAAPKKVTKPVKPWVAPTCEEPKPEAAKPPSEPEPVEKYDQQIQAWAKAQEAAEKEKERQGKAEMPGGGRFQILPPWMRKTLRAALAVFLMVGLIFVGYESWQVHQEEKSKAEVKEAEVKATTLYRQATEGDAMAQNSLGVMYNNGEGVSKDYKEAAYWYRKAAEQGNMYAQFNLAQEYAYGQGVWQSASEARKWYEKSAAQGYPKAQKALERIEADKFHLPSLNQILVVSIFFIFLAAYIFILFVAKGVATKWCQHFSQPYTGGSDATETRVQPAWARLKNPMILATSQGAFIALAVGLLAIIPMKLFYGNPAGQEHLLSWKPMVIVMGWGWLFGTAACLLAVAFPKLQIVRWSKDFLLIVASGAFAGIGLGVAFFIYVFGFASPQESSRFLSAIQYVPWGTGIGSLAGAAIVLVVGLSPKKAAKEH